MYCSMYCTLYVLCAVRGGHVGFCPFLISMHALAVFCAALAWPAALSDRLHAAPSRFGFPSGNSFPVPVSRARIARAQPFPRPCNLQVFYEEGFEHLDSETTDPSFDEMNTSTRVSRLVDVPFDLGVDSVLPEFALGCPDLGRPLEPFALTSGPFTPATSGTSFWSWNTMAPSSDAHLAALGLPDALVTASNALAQVWQDLDSLLEPFVLTFGPLAPATSSTSFELVNTSEHFSDASSTALSLPEPPVIPMTAGEASKLISDMVQHIPPFIIPDHELLAINASCPELLLAADYWSPSDLSHPPSTPLVPYRLREHCRWQLPPGFGTQIHQFYAWMQLLSPPRYDLRRRDYRRLAKLRQRHSLARPHVVRALDVRAIGTPPSLDWLPSNKLVSARLPLYSHQLVREQVMHCRLPTLERRQLRDYARNLTCVSTFSAPEPRPWFSLGSLAVAMWSPCSTLALHTLWLFAAVVDLSTTVYLNAIIAVLTATRRTSPSSSVTSTWPLWAVCCGLPI